MLYCYTSVLLLYQGVTSALVRPRYEHCFWCLFPAASPSLFFQALSLDNSLFFHFHRVNISPWPQWAKDGTDIVRMKYKETLLGLLGETLLDLMVRPRAARGIMQPCIKAAYWWRWSVEEAEQEMERNWPYKHIASEQDLKLDPLLDFQLGKPKTSLFIVASLSGVFCCNEKIPNS